MSVEPLPETSERASTEEAKLLECLRKIGKGLTLREIGVNKC